MVEEATYHPNLEPLLEHGYHKVFAQVAVSSLNKRDFDMNLSSGKDLLGGKDLRKTSTVWKLLMLVVVGACGVYICMIGVDRRLSYHQGTHQIMVFQGLNHSGNSTCPNLPSTLDFPQHYPGPTAFQREECMCTPVHNFAILSMQRSGSGWFETFLNNHPNISSHGEIFAIPSRRENFSTIVETLDTIYNLEWVNSAAKNSCTAAVGLKWMLNQGALEYHREVVSYFQQKGVSVIALLRRNALKRLISTLANAYDKKEKLLNGTHKSHVHSNEEAKTLAKFKPVLDVEHLPLNLQRVQEITSDALRLFNGTRLMLVYYEDLVKDPSQMVKVQEFLGLEPRTLQSEQVKIHTQPLQELVQNWDEVLAQLRGLSLKGFSQTKIIYDCFWTLL